MRKKIDTPDLSNEMSFKMWTVESITQVQTDVEWMKKVLSPSIYIAIISSIVSVSLLILRVTGR
jgi:hypothetical protein